MYLQRTSYSLRALRLLLLTFSVLLAALHAAAQTTGSGSITGLVADQTGAVIPEAEVTATSAATGVSVVRKTTNAGLFTLQPLSVGDYIVTITANGFGRRSTGSIHVDALQVVTLNLKLSVTADLSVDVTSGGLDTADATVGDSVNSQDYQLLPLIMNGGPRDPTAFIQLANGINSRGGYNGGIGYNNETYLDGVVATSINQQGSAQNTSSGAIVEAVEQSEVRTVGTSAKYQGQGFNNFTLKSGTNAFHGSIFEFFRNTVLDTYNYLSKQQTPLIKPNEKQNEYGGAVGGPIHRDKAFFFLAYEKMNFRQSPNPGFVTLPTLAMRAGDFSGYDLGTVSPSVPGGYHIYDPDSTACTGTPVSCSRTQFMKDMIPASRLSPIALKLQAGLPTNFANSNIINNYLVGQPFGTDYFKASGKIDFQLTQKHRLTATYLAGQSNNVFLNTGSVLPLPYSAGVHTLTLSHTAILGLNSVLTPHIVNDLKYSYLRNVNNTSDPVSGGAYSAQAQGLGPLASGWASSFPVVIFNGNNSFLGIDSANGNGSTNRPFNNYLNTFGFTDDLQWTKGRHNLSVGGSFEWYQFNSELPTGNSSASFTFDTSTTSNFNKSANGTTISTTQGSSYAGFLLGDLTAFYTSKSSDFTTIGTRFKGISPYFQDDWTVNKDLTLNLGLRWDLYTPVREVLDRVTFFNPDVPNPIVPSFKGAVTYAGNRTPYSCNCHNRYSTYLGNIEPRLGFAFKAAPDTVIRGSYGITTTHSGGEGGRGGASGGTSQFGLASSVFLGQNYGYEPVLQWDHPLPVPPPPSLDNTYGIGFTTTPGFTSTPTIIYYDEPQLARRSTYFQNFEFGIEKQLFTKTLVSVDYSGSVGHFLGDSNGRGVYSNQIQPQFLVLGGLLSAAASPANFAAANVVLANNGLASISLPYANYDTSKTIGQSLRPYPMYALAEIFAQDANSAYNGFQFSLKQQTFKGVSLTINYTYSRLIDDIAARTSTYVNTNRWNVDNGPQALRIYGSWVTPGVEKSHRFVHAVTAGWITSTIYSYSSANPLSFSTACQSYFTYFGGCRTTLNPQFTGSTIRNNVPYGPANFTQSAFQQGALTTSGTAFGNAPLNNPYGATGPSTYLWDGSIRRRFSFGEARGFTIGADVFNITNHTEATGINTNITSRAFGTAGQQSNRSRDIQLSAKIEF